MGRIKQIYLKRVAKGLLSEYPEEFTTDFDHNKSRVLELANVQSKPIRNKIAGSICRTMKKREAAKD